MAPYKNHFQSQASAVGKPVNISASISGHLGHGTATALCIPVLHLPEENPNRTSTKIVLIVVYEKFPKSSQNFGV